MQVRVHLDESEKHRRTYNLALSGNTSQSGRREAHLHKRVVVDLHPATAIGVVTLERFRQCLDHHTRPYEAIKCDAGSTS